MIPNECALLLHLDRDLAARVGKVSVLAHVNDDDLVIDVYYTWAKVDGGYEVDKRASLTPEAMGDVQDVVRERVGTQYHDARHASKWSKAKTSGKVRHTRQKPVRIGRHI